MCIVRLAVAEGWGADAGPCVCVCFRGWLAVSVLLCGGWCFLTRRGLWLQGWGLAWSGLLPCLCRWGVVAVAAAVALAGVVCSRVG